MALHNMEPPTALPERNLTAATLKGLGHQPGTIDSRFDVRLDLHGRSGRLVSFDGVVVDDQELAEVPLDVASEHPQERLVGSTALQLLVQGMGIVSIDVDLGEQWELGAFVLSEGLDLGVGARLLGAELVAGKGQHRELVAAELGSQLDQLFVVGLGQTSLRSHVHNEDGRNGAVFGSEVNIVAINVKRTLAVKESSRQPKSTARGSTLYPSQGRSLAAGNPARKG